MILGGKWRWWAPLLIALGADMLWSILVPESSTALGRLPYALAVGGGLAALELVRNQSPWIQHGAMAVGSWLTTAVWEGFSHHTIQWSVPWISLVTIPWFGGVVYPLGLVTAMIQQNEFNIVFRGIADASHGLLNLCVWASCMIPGLWRVSPTAWWLALPFAVISAVLWSRRSWKRLVVWTWMIVVVSGIHLGWQRVRAPRTQVVQLDVGQGDAALVWFAGQTGLIDVGSAHARHGAFWVETLARWGVDRLDFVMLTHLDEDHAGGLGILRELLPLRCVSTHSRLVAHFLGAPLIPVGQGCEPFPTWELDSARGPNGTMVAAWVDGYANAGDAKGAAVRAWFRELDRVGMLNKLKIWKVSHHGSKTSMDEPGLLARAPGLKACWISAGRRNRFGHPHPALMDRLHDVCPSIRRTDRDHDISLYDD
jgi:beta-lactamase superfamily II metal-dependent hydrolase